MIKVKNMKSIYLFLFVILSATTESKGQLQSINKKFAIQLSDAAISIINPNIIYDPSYFGIKYPNGDVPKNKGVCTDVIIRVYRKLGIDLQKEVHEDMKSHFSLYPNLKKWGMTKTDSNIDHRRVPNLEVFFERKGKKITYFKKCQ